LTELNLSTQSDRGASDWEHTLRACLPLYGHRNWIVVADSAYPAQSKAGIETVVADADQVDVVRRVVEAIDACRHVRANVYLDTELDFVTEDDAPGITEYQRQLDTALCGASAKHMLHEEIIGKLDRCAQVFRILVLKTSLALPYTSVFFELDCGYWNAEAEKRLREAMVEADSK
jgi:hypothetical protein